MGKDDEHYEMINGEVHTPSELVGKTVYYMLRKMTVLGTGKYKGTVNIQGDDSLHCDVPLKDLELIK